MAVSGCQHSHEWLLGSVGGTREQQRAVIRLILMIVILLAITCFNNDYLTAVSLHMLLPFPPVLWSSMRGADAVCFTGDNMDTTVIDTIEGITWVPLRYYHAWR
jgi:hypothetical protein